MSSNCINCCYYGIAGDAPEDTEPGCMWTPSEDDGWELPCMGTEEADHDEL